MQGLFKHDYFNTLKGIPVFKIEDPLIETLVNGIGTKILFFSNPQTVPLAMSKIAVAYKNSGQRKDHQAVVMPDVFSLLLSSQKVTDQQALIASVSEFI